MRRTKEEAAVTRATLLKTALTLFSARGYAATSIDDITKAAKMTRGALYHHFQSKADLYNTLVEEVSATGANIVQRAAAEGGTFTEILKRVFIRQLVYIEENKEARAVMELALFKTGMHPELGAGREKQIQSGQMMVESIAQAMQIGVGSGELRNDISPLEMARSFIAFQNGIIHLWLVSPKSFSLKGSAETFADVLLEGLKRSE
ncbi:MAG: TetR family transcriptional regulator [Anaerolineales bacterium]|nr:MAG: TetR family transcriptional regulator [Anaerolineales bacterium]